MRKLVQDLEKGQMRLMEVPEPKPGPQEVLVRNRFSVISPGTEGKTVRDARKGYWAKAQARREEVKKVIRTAREKGVRETYRIVKDRLQAPSALGYSCCGEVAEVGSAVEGLRSGDMVTCAGNQAGHAEWVCVPQMLCAKVPDGVKPEAAAFTTIGAIALQGIRRAELGIGANALVIGGGLIGAITGKLLQAGGMRPILVDRDSERVSFAKELGLANSFERGQEDLEERIESLTDGKGVDAVLITAATASTDPVDLAGRSARQGGKVVMVGDAATGFQRKAYYQKELELRMSKSYGPGRHEPAYEEKGQDHPIGLLRWTENRNMKAVLDLQASNHMELSALITHRYSFDEAKTAYDKMLASQELAMGILLEYPERQEAPYRTHTASRKNVPPEGPCIGIIGGGSFARNTLLPALPSDLQLIHIATRDGAVARYLGEKYGASRWSSDPQALIEDKDLDAVMIATRHDSHGKLTTDALQAGKHVFVEKPLCIQEGELQAIQEAHEASSGTLMLGFNRRFAPLFGELLRELDPATPKAIRIHVNAPPLTSDHWVNDPDVGGGRVLGETCHFIDLVAAIAESPIEQVDGAGWPDPEKPDDTVIASIRCRDGSIASLSYSSKGSPEQPKERIEVDQHGRSLMLTDFRELRVLGTKEKKRQKAQDKGHTEELRRWSKGLKEGSAPLPFEQVLNSTWATFELERKRKTPGQ